MQKRHLAAVTPLVMLFVWAISSNASPQINKEYAAESKAPEITHRLVIAAHNWDIPSIRILIAQGIDLNVYDQQGDTALVAAAKGGHLDAVKELLESGADLNLRDRNGNTALLMSVSSKHVSVTRELLGLNPDEYSRKGAFRAAIATGQTEIMKELIASGVDPTETTPGITHITLAVMNNQPEAVDLLIESGANVNNNPDDQSSHNAFGYAASSGKIEMCKKLIAAGADQKSKNIGLFWAVSIRNIELVKLFVDEGADANAKSETGKTALEIATEGKYQDVLKFFRDHGIGN